MLWIRCVLTATLSVRFARITTMIVTNISTDQELHATDIFVTPRMRAFVVAKAHLSSTKPQQFFDGIVQADGSVRKPLASEINEKGWYELPGPSKLWPDNSSWYEMHGFEVDPDQTEATIKALAVMESGYWTEGWVKAMIRGDETSPDYSIRWDEV
jgi:hypothetical protein